MLSAVKHFYAYDDGDVITPGMGISIDTGYGLVQNFNPSTGKVISTDFTQHPAVLFPKPYSSKEGTIVVPETVGQQWYYNNPDSSEAAVIGDDGAVKSKIADIFELTTITQNAKTFPALKIKGNLATVADHTDKYIYYKSTYCGKAFTCSQKIDIHETTGNTYEVLLSVTGENGAGDDVLSNDNDWVQLSAYLQMGGNNVVGATYKFQHLVGGVWTDITSSTGQFEITDNVIKIFASAIDGTDNIRAVATYNSLSYYKVFPVTDIHDPYYINDNCNIPGGAVKKSETITMKPSVINRSDGTDVTSSEGWSFGYTVSEDDGTVIKSSTGSTFSYSGTDVAAHKQIGVRIEAEKS